jgi:hypothetical protein
MAFLYTPTLSATAALDAIASADAVDEALEFERMISPPILLEGFDFRIVPKNRFIACEKLISRAATAADAEMESLEP